MNVDVLLNEQTDLILLVLDTDGQILYLNPAARQLFHLAQNNGIGRSFYSVLDEYSRVKSDLMVALTLRDGSVKDWELNHVQPDGEPVLVGYNTCILRGENHQVIGIGAVGSDLNARLELTAQLARTNQELEGTLAQLEKALSELKSTQAQLLQSEKMRALGQMVAGVAHEINNPLGFARNNFIYLGEKLPELKALFKSYTHLKNMASAEDLLTIQQAEQRAGIEYVWDDFEDAIQEGLEGLNRIREIVLSLRNFSHLDEAEVKVADLNQGLRSTIRLLKPLCKDRIRIEEMYGSIPPIVCHPGELNQVFLNLLTNSIQAIEGPGQIRVATLRSENTIRIHIVDNGKGMDQQTLARLGEPFFTTKPVGAGVGLGLAISYGIIQHHQGRLQFESQPGAGTTATIDLPIQ